LLLTGCRCSCSWVRAPLPLKGPSIMASLTSVVWLLAAFTSPQLTFSPFGLDAAGGDIAPRTARAVGATTDTCLYAVRVSSDAADATGVGISTLHTFAGYSSPNCAPPADRVLAGPAAADVLATRLLTVDVPRYHFCVGQPSGCECRFVSLSDFSSPLCAALLVKQPAPPPHGK
jgi:hypothetical protein